MHAIPGYTEKKRPLRLANEQQKSQTISLIFAYQGPGSSNTLIVSLETRDRVLPRCKNICSTSLGDTLTQLVARGKIQEVYYTTLRSLPRQLLRRREIWTARVSNTSLVRFRLQFKNFNWLFLIDLRSLYILSTITERLLLQWLPVAKIII